MITTICPNCGARRIEGLRSILITAFLSVAFALFFLVVFEFVRDRFYPEAPMLIHPNFQQITYG